MPSVHFCDIYIIVSLLCCHGNVSRRDLKKTFLSLSGTRFHGNVILKAKMAAERRVFKLRWLVWDVSRSANYVWECVRQWRIMTTTLRRKYLLSRIHSEVDLCSSICSVDILTPESWGVIPSWFHGGVCRTTPYCGICLQLALRDLLILKLISPTFAYLF